MTSTSPISVLTPPCSPNQSQTAGGRGCGALTAQTWQGEKTVKWRLIGSRPKLYSVRAIYSIFQAATYWVYCSGGNECGESEDSAQGMGDVLKDQLLRTGSWSSVKLLTHRLLLGLYPWYEFSVLPFMERTVHLLYMTHPFLVSCKPCPPSREALRCTFSVHVIPVS